jgi:hypothetical protein
LGHGSRTHPRSEGGRPAGYRRRRAEILGSVDIAEASPVRGEGRVITEESMRQLAREALRHQRLLTVSQRFLTEPAPDRIAVQLDALREYRTYPWRRNSPPPRDRKLYQISFKAI